MVYQNAGKSSTVATIALLGVLNFASAVLAESATLIHGNSEVGIDTDNLETMFFWTVDGEDHLIE